MNQKLADLLAKANDLDAKLNGFRRRSLLASRHLGSTLFALKKIIGHGNWQSWRDANFTGKPSTAKNCQRIAKHWNDSSFVAKRTADPDMGYEAAVVLLASLRKKSKPRSKAQALLESLKFVLGGVTRGAEDETEQSGCFACKNGRVHTYNDHASFSAPSPFGDALEGVFRANSLVRMLKRVRNKEIAFSADAAGICIKSPHEGWDGTSLFYVENTIRMPLERVTPPSAWRKLPESFAEAVKFILPPVTGADKRDCRSACVHFHPDRIEARDGTYSSQCSLAGLVKKPAVVRGSDIDYAIKGGVTEISESVGWLHFRNAIGGIVSCRVMAEEKPRAKSRGTRQQPRPQPADPTRLLMLDSGAFTVWTLGAKIDLEEYIDFCEAHDGVSYFVNLDVIPGRPHDKASLTPSAIEEACQQGFKNYKRMIARLPQEKVIPVFHQGESPRWLHKYLEAGAAYVGISPGNDRRTTGGEGRHAFAERELLGSPSESKLAWLRRIKRHLLDAAGRPVVKTHGFAVTSFKLIKEMKWHSVDSASWKLAAGNGSVYLPRTVNGVWDFTQKPRVIPVSRVMDGYSRLGADTRDKLDQFAEECGVRIGAAKIVQQQKGYRLNREQGEVWFDKQQHAVLVTIEKGIVAGKGEERLIMNAEFMKKANAALWDTVRHIYFAGGLMPFPIEFNLGKRLLSFHAIQGDESVRRLKKHERMVDQQ